jgi:murein DD-endopeptidase MepM/ murein hydrolase activator NlpD
MEAFKGSMENILFLIIVSIVVLVLILTIALKKLPLLGQTGKLWAEETSSLPAYQTGSSQPEACVNQQTLEIYLKWPTEDGTISSWFCKEREGTSEPHRGIDIAVSKGTPVYAAESGIVYDVYRSCSERADCPNIEGRKGFGNYIILKHTDPNGKEYYTWYLHLKSVNVKKNQGIEKGKEIGKSGNTGYSEGPHLHFSISIEPIYDIQYMLNPCDYLECEKHRQVA